MPSPFHRLPCLLALGFAAFVGFGGCAPTAKPPAEPVQYTYEVVHSWPHDPHAFTQGLVFLDGRLFESTGQYGQSTLREVDLTTGAVKRQVSVPREFFAEGLAVIGNKAYQLTWQNHVVFCYNLETFQFEKKFNIDGEGWGLATDGKSLILSDGTSRLRFLDPATLAVQRTVDVRLRGQPLKELNELEYINGEIYANLWQTNVIVRINPQTGDVVGVIDFSGLLPPAERAPTTDVLNGIAYDASANRLFVTGKNWPKLYEVRLKAK